jgi:hypothetical protein
VILQLVDEGKVSLDDPVSKYGIVLTSPGTILVRHLMSHTSEGLPGTHYAYNGDRYSLLDSVIAHASGKSFAAAVQERIIVPLGLKHTAATPQSAAFAASGLDKATYLANVAPGYVWTGTQYAPTAYQTLFSSAAGLTASAGLAGWVEFYLLRRELDKRIGRTRLVPSRMLRLWGAALAGAAIPWAYKFAMDRTSPILSIHETAVRTKLMALVLLCVYGLAYLGITAAFGIPEARNVFDQAAVVQSGTSASKPRINETGLTRGGLSPQSEISQSEPGFSRVV